MYIATLVLANEFSKRLQMPFWDRVSFIIFAALFPMWSAIALILRIIHTFCFRYRPTHDFKLLFARAVGMYAVAPGQPAHYHRNWEDSPELLPLETQVHHLSVLFPEGIPLSELDTFYLLYADDLTKGVQLSFENNRRREDILLGRDWLGRAVSILLSLAYIGQALTTIVMVIRRAGFRSEDVKAEGVPIVTPIATVTHFVTPGTALILADTQAFRLSVFGITIAASLVILVFLNIRYEFIWGASFWHGIRYPEYPISSDYKAKRAFFGFVISVLVDVALWRLGHFDTAYGHLYFLLYFTFKGHFPYAVVVLIISILLIVFTLVIRRSNSFQFQAFKRSCWPLPRNVRYILIYVVWFSFDYYRHIVSLVYFQRRGFRPIAFKDIRIHGKDIEIKAGWLIFLFVSQLIFQVWPMVAFVRILRQGGQYHGTLPATSTAGCVYKTEVYPWMWKDPLADKVWAL